MKPFFKTLSLFTALFGFNHAQALDLGSLREDVAIQIDGKLDEVAWQRATKIGELKTLSPPTLETPKYDTEIKIVAATKGLYIAFVNQQEEVSQVRRLSARDTDINRDTVLVAVDSQGTGLNGRFFELALGDTQIDGTIIDENELSRDWDGPWYGATSSDKKAWYAEFFLPWSMFSFSKVEGGKQLFNIYFERKFSQANEVWGRPSLPESKGIFISGFEKVKVQALPKSSDFAFYPYISETHDFLEHEDDVDGGFDLFWQKSKSTQLALTVNPDFAQVEADALEINLTSFETSFPEKRAFFLERQELFDSGKLNFVHTRRIGAKPEPFNVTGQSVSGLNNISDIDFASKITTKKSNTQLGWLSAKEADTDFLLNNQAAVQDGRVFNAFRVLSEFQNNNYFNLGLLSTFKDHPDKTAQVHSVDSHMRNSAGNIWGGVQLARTETEQNVNSEIIAETGYGATFEANYSSGRGDKHYTSLETYDDQFNVRDMGFLRRNEYHAWQYSFTRNTPSAYGLKNLKSYLFLLSGFNDDDRLVFSTILSRWTATTKNQNLFEWRFQLNPARWEDRLGPTDYKMTPRPEFGLKWEGDKSKILSSIVEFNLIGEGTGQMTQALKVSLKYLPSDRLSLGSDLEYRFLNSHIQYLPNSDASAFCLCTVDATQWTPNISASYFFSARQLVSLNLQGLTRKAQAQQAYSIGSGGKLVRVTSTESDFDYNRHQLALQLKYRLEVAPLSDFFVVYSRKSNVNNAIESASDNLVEAFEHPYQENLTVKLRYRFSG